MNESEIAASAKGRSELPTFTLFALGLGLIFFGIPMNIEHLCRSWWALAKRDNCSSWAEVGVAPLAD